MGAQTRANLLRFIGDLKVQTVNNNRRRIRSIVGISENNDIAPPGGVVSIATFFAQASGHALRYPTLVCIQLAPMTWVPLEWCEVVEGQPYRKTLSEDQTRRLIAFSRLIPDVRLQSIRNGLQVLGYSQSPCLQELGMKVDPNPMTIAGRILPTPTLACRRNATIQPRNGQ